MTASPPVLPGLPPLPVVVWLALAAAVSLLAAPTLAPARVRALSGSARLAGPTRPRWSRWTRGPGRSAVVAGGAGTVALVTSVAGPVLAGTALACYAVAVRLGVDRLRRVAADRRHQDLLTATAVLAGELAAGAQPATALASAAAAVDGTALRDELAGAAESARRAADAAAVLLGSADPGVRALGLAWRLVDATGAALAGVVERVAADLRTRDTQRRAVAVALAGPRSSAFVLSVLPLVGVALGAAMGARPVPFLLGPGPGRALCCAGVLLDLAGILWIRRIVRRAEAP